MPAFDPNQRQAPAAQGAIALFRISQALGHIQRLVGTAEQLSPAQINTLLFLKYARRGVRTIGGLAKRLSATYATASGVADALENKQLIERHPLPADQRTVLLSLTGAGERQTAVLDSLLDEIEAAIAELPVAEQAALVRATQAIVRRLQGSGHVQVYEMCWGCQFFRQDAHPDDPVGAHHCAFVDAPLTEIHLECPDFIPV